MEKNNKELEGEELWNLDVIELLKPEIEPYVVDKHQVVRGLSIKKKNNNYCFDYVTSQQDVVIYGKNDVFDQEGERYVIPKIICELKYEGVNTGALIAISDTASKMKSIFPECKIILLVRYSGKSDKNRNELLLHWGQGFDRIMCLEDGKKKGKYVKGDYSKELEESPELNEKWRKLVDYIKEELAGPSEGFVK